MDKAGKEGKPWISGLFDFRITPQSGSIASPLQELLPGTPVWVQHRQNATWEPAIVVNQCTPNSLDNAGKWCRATQSVQVHQNNVENKIYSQLMANGKPK